MEFLKMFWPFIVVILLTALLGKTLGRALGKAIADMVNHKGG